MRSSATEWLKRVAFAAVLLMGCSVPWGVAGAKEKPAAAGKNEGQRGDAAVKEKAAEAVKPAAAEPDAVEEKERARRIKAAEALLKRPDVGDSYRKGVIAQMSAEIKLLNQELEQLQQVEDRKERRAAEHKMRSVQGKIKRARVALDKELIKTYKPLKAKYDGLKLKDKALQDKIEATHDDKQKNRLEIERAKSFGAMEGLERQMGLIEYFVQDCEPPTVDAAPDGEEAKP